MDGIPKSAAETFETDFCNITVFEDDSSTERQHICTEEMDVDLSRLAVSCKLEVMVLEVGETMAHIGLAGGDLCLPERGPFAPDMNMASNVTEVRANDQLRTEAAATQLGASQVKVIAFLKPVISEFIALSDADAKRHAIRSDEVDSCKLGFFPSILGM